MTNLERKHYMYTQLRIIRSYHTHVHPELNQAAVTILWISLYAAMFQAWWNKNAL